VAELLGDELLGLDLLAVRLGPVVLADIALGDELVALGELEVSALGVLLNATRSWKVVSVCVNDPSGSLR